MYEALVARVRYHIQKANFMGLKEAESTLLLNEAADAIEELQKVLDAVNDAHNDGYDVGYWAGRRDYEPNWIPVTERLPRDRQFVLVYCGDNKRIRPSDRFDVAILLGDSIFTSLGVTHWMPLPPAPKEET